LDRKKREEEVWKKKDQKKQEELGTSEEILKSQKEDKRTCWVDINGVCKSHTYVP